MNPRLLSGSIVGPHRYGDLVIRKILLCHRFFYLDHSNGASIANRCLMEGLAARGFGVEVLCGTLIDSGPEGDPAVVLAQQGQAFELVGGEPGEPPHLRLVHKGVPVTIHRRPLRRYQEPEQAEIEEFLLLHEAVCDRVRPDVLVTLGGDRLEHLIAARSRRRGMATVFTLHNFGYRHLEPFEDIDEILVASHFSAEFHLDALGLACTVLPNLIDEPRVRAERREPRYVTFVNPSQDKGAAAFARIASELDRLRPDIPLLVVEGRGRSSNLADCGLDLATIHNLEIRPQTSDPREFWGVTRICLLPSLWWENQPLVAVEAMINGIPVIGSDRGGIPETLGNSGIVLALPDWLSPALKVMPTAEEVKPWVEAVIRLWDDAALYAEHERLALAESRRWASDVVGPCYERFFAEIQPGGRPTVESSGRDLSVVLVPYLGGIDDDCERALRELESADVEVVRSSGCAAIDLARNLLVSQALHDGFESILFIDADIGFDPLDALRLLARPEPVVAGIYAKKGRREMASHFAGGIDQIILGPEAPGLYPLKFAATGFLRIRCEVLRRMIEELKLPLCNTKWGLGFWPFFEPLTLPEDEGRFHYLGEDWAFSHRLRQIGVTPLADTSFRLWHYGRYGYSWEDVGADPMRYRSYNLKT